MSVTSPLFGITGWSGSGKTTLLTTLLPHLLRHCATIHTIKHARHDATIDHDGSDSHRHQASGAHETMLATPHGWGLMHRSQTEWSLPQLLERMSPAELILIEGFKHEPHPKLEVHRLANGTDFVYPTIDNVLALASDGAPPDDFSGSFFALHDYEAMSSFIMTHKRQL